MQERSSPPDKKFHHLVLPCRLSDALRQLMQYVGMRLVSPLAESETSSRRPGDLATRRLSHRQEDYHKATERMSARFKVVKIDRNRLEDHWWSLTAFSLLAKTGISHHHYSSDFPEMLVNTRFQALDHLTPQQCVDNSTAESHPITPPCRPTTVRFLDLWLPCCED